MTDAERGAWIDLVISRSRDLRRAGVLSIGVDGCMAGFTTADPEPQDEGDEGDDPAWSEPRNPWEDPASYPSGIVPDFDVEDLIDRRGR